MDAAASLAVEGRAAEHGRTRPRFQVDPMWPTIPDQWTLGQVSGLDVDSTGNLCTAEAGGGRRVQTFLLSRP